MGNLHFENLSLEFCEQTHDIEVSCIEEPWSLEQIKGLVNDKNAVARVGIIDSEIVCYYSFYNICNEGNVNNLAVKSDYRGKGIGNLLIEDMLKTSKDIKLSALTLEVNVNNTVAIALYKKYGFEIEGKRIKFYGGKDDALIMWKRDI